MSGGAGECQSEHQSDIGQARSQCAAARGSWTAGQQDLRCQQVSKSDFKDTIPKFWQLRKN